MNLLFFPLCCCCCCCGTIATLTRSAMTLCFSLQQRKVFTKCIRSTCLRAKWRYPRIYCARVLPTVRPSLYCRSARGNSSGTQRLSCLDKYSPSFWILDFDRLANCNVASVSLWMHGSRASMHTTYVLYVRERTKKRRSGVSAMQQITPNWKRNKGIGAPPRTRNSKPHFSCVLPTK